MGRIHITEGFSYDDILITPKYSSQKSRKNISLTTKVSRNITLNLPIVSSNMDTITEENMAIEMALHGGIGILHRYCSISEQVDMVKKVKRYTNSRIENPYTITENESIDTLIKKSTEYGVTSFLVVDDSNHTLVGIVTKRDITYYTENSNINKIKDIMTPFNKLIVAEHDITTDDALAKMVSNRIEKLPLIDRERKIVGLLTLKDILYNRKTYTISTIDERGGLRVGAAVGINKDYLDRTLALIENDCDLIVVDVAHGHHELMKDAISNIRKLCVKMDRQVDIIAGNVCTPEGTRFLCECGVDGIKVGIGPGSICTTRIQTGCGYPQFSAVMNCAEVAKGYGIPIIADGGHRGKIGNIVKALAVGSSCSMLGGFISGTTETPGSIVVKGNKKYKMIRGMAGRISNMKKSARIQEEMDVSDITPEGVEGYVEYKGRVRYILGQIRGGIQSGLSYCGVGSIEELHYSELEFVRITSSGKQESGSHDISEI